MGKRNLVHRFLCWLVRIGTRLLCRIDYTHLEQVPKQGPLILVTNHIGSLEVPLLFAHLQPRTITGFAKIETWDNPLMGWLFDIWGAIPLRRGEADLDALRRALTFLESGHILAVAPEGTRSWNGKLLRAKPGVVLIALHSGAPILPIAHWGSENFGQNVKNLKRTDFHIKVGKPFYLRNNRSGRLTHADRQQIADTIMFQIAALLPTEYRGAYSMIGQSKEEYLEFCDFNGTGKNTGLSSTF